MRFLKKLKTRRKFRRRFKGLFKRSISQKYLMICFIGNNQKLLVDQKTLAELFQRSIAFANYHLKKWLRWIVAWLIKIPVHLTGLFKNLITNHPSSMLFVASMCLALLLLHQQVKQMNKSIMSWLKKKFKWPRIGCLAIIILAIYFLLIVVTDIPVFPIIRIIKYIISRISKKDVEVNPAKPVLMTEMIDESKYNGERNKLIFLSVMTFIIFRYLLNQYKRRVFENIPLGKILIQIYDNDMNDSTDSLIPIFL